MAKVAQMDPATVLEQVSSRLPSAREDIIPVLSNLEAGMDNVPLKKCLGQALATVRALPKHSMVPLSLLDLRVTQEMLDWNGPVRKPWCKDTHLKYSG